MSSPVKLIVALACLAPAAHALTDSDYADPKLCAGCHREIAENYAKTGMGRAFFRPAPSNMPEVSTSRLGNSTQDFYHQLSDTRFSMTIRGGQYFQRRWQTGFEGKEVNVE